MTINKKMLFMVMILTACSSSTPDMLKELQAHKDKLEPVGRKLYEAGDGAIIDFRDSPVSFKPEALQASITEKDIQSLKNANITFATYDALFGGVLFEVEGKGISVSGSSTGFFLQQEESDVEKVDNLSRVMQEKISEAQKHESPNIRAIQLVEDQWGLYLETF